MLEVFLIFGVCLAIVSAYERFTVIYYPRPLSVSEGFVLYASDYASQPQTVYVFVDSIQMVEERSSAALDLQWKFTAEGTNSTLIVGVRTPWDAEILQTYVVMFGVGGSELEDVVFNRVRSENATSTYFEATMSRLSKDGRLSTQFLFDIHMLLKDLLYRKSYSGYSLVVPFSFFDTDHSSQLKPFYLSKTNRSILGVHPPSDTSVVGTNPSAIGFTFFKGKLWYYWNISLIAMSMPDLIVAAVALDMENNSLTSWEQDVNYWTALGFGVGVPLIPTSFVERLKLGRIREKNSRRNCSALLSYLSRQWGLDLRPEDW
jgi:hypothetical protein